MVTSLRLAALACALLVGCGDDSGGPMDTGTSDTGGPLDSSVSDGDPGDSGGDAADSGTATDGGPTDGAPTDTRAMADGSVPPCTGTTCIVDISAGYDHTCAVRVDGLVFCWGANTRGQIGDGTTVASSSPSRVTGLSGAVDVEAGAGHTCALLSDDTVMCWGANEMGQLGDGTMLDRSTPVAVGGLTDVLEIGVGGHRTDEAVGLSAARMADGSVAYWGAFPTGLGAVLETTFTPTVSPVTWPGVVATSLAVGGTHTCFENDAGVLKCWGDNHVRQIGGVIPGGCDPSSFILPLPLYLDAPEEPCPGVSGRTFDGLSLGIARTCVLADGEPTCWGLMITEIVLPNQLVFVNATRAADVDEPPTRLAPAGDQIVSGLNHDCFVLDGDVQCRSINGRGEIGDGTTTMHEDFSPTSGLSDVVALTAGIHHTCALDGDGNVSCWGANEAGQIGDGSTADALIPERVRVEE